MEIKNETQDNRKNEYEESQDDVVDSESIYEYGNNQSENDRKYKISKKRAPHYLHMNTVGYINNHV